MAVEVAGNDITVDLGSMVSPRLVGNMQGGGCSCSTREEGQL
jgi:hypothetical protein